MSESIDPKPLDASTANPNHEPVVAPATSGPRGYVFLSWFVLFAIAGGFIYLQNAKSTVDAMQRRRDESNLVTLELQTRMYMGFELMFSKLLEDDKARDRQHAQIVAIVRSFNRGSVEQRLAAIVALGELEGPTAAHDALEELDADIKKAKLELSERDTKLLSIETRLYDDYMNKRPTAPTVSPEERQFFEQSLGWFGELALSPSLPAEQADGQDQARRNALLGEAKQTAVAGITLALVAILGFLVGGTGLLAMGLLAIRGKWVSRIGPPVAHHSVYVETFAIWLLIYLPLMIFLPGLLSDRIMMPVRQAIALFLSLIALAWPVMRGIRWSQVRQDLGITWGSQPFLEPTLGFISYLNAWPFLIVGFGFMVVLGAVTVKAAPPQGDPFQPSPSIAHPLVAQLRTATAADILPYFLLMCVAAPVVEEIAFRGLLYRHLRDASRGWKIGGLFSVLAVSILFAAVHPQGVLAIPLLASLACGFALAREWRGTLIPAIIAHGLNNSMFLAFMIFALMR